MKQFVFTQFKNHKMGFLFEDGKVTDIRCYEDASILGNIYVARVSNLSPNINAAFVDIQKQESCYLSMDDYHGAPLKTGDLVFVQVIRDKIKSKRYAVTTDLSIQGDYTVATLHAPIGVSAKISNPSRRRELKALMQAEITRVWTKRKETVGGIIRTQAEQAEDAQIIEELGQQLQTLDAILERAKYATQYSCLYQTELAYIKDIRRYRELQEVEILTDVPAVVEAIPELTLYKEAYALSLRYSLEGLMEKVLAKRVYLKSGAYLVIEPTEAMTVIDVNSGKSIKGKNAEEQFLKINIEAAKEIARQLRLRNLSGIIMVDFISMKEESNKQALLSRLAEFVRMDTMRTTVVDMTKLGLVEITRQKERRALHEIFASTGTKKDG